MRLQIFSDVHLDARPVEPPRLGAAVDVVVVAGDLCEGIGNGARWLRQHLGRDVPIVMVAGNHEYFERVRPVECRDGAAAARVLRVTFLDNDAAVLGGVRFIGTTLWADYRLFGVARRHEMMDVARRRMMDHRRILEEPGRLITPEDVLGLHRIARDFIGAQLAVPHDGPTVVVSHHGPHPLSLADRYREDPLSAAFISDLSSEIEGYQPALWVHGHTHVSLDYRVGSTRVICNPHGYGDENPSFDKGLIVSI